MDRRILLSLWALLLAALGASPLPAQSGKAGPDFEVKVRQGLTMGNLKSDLHDQKVLGLAVEGTFPLAGKGSLVFQLDYTYLPGGDYDNMPGTTFDGRTLLVTSSADRRKLRLEGFGLRAGYRAPLFADLDWQAGLALNRFRATEEVSGTLRPAGVASAQYESLAYTPEKAKITPALFAGVKYRVNDAFSLEANLLGIGFNTVKWQPYWYTGQNAAPAGAPPVGTTTTENRTGFAVEIAIGLRL